MSGSKGGSNRQTTTIDPRLTSALLGNNAQSQQVANNLGVRQFEGFNADQNSAFDATRAAAGMGTGAVDSALNLTQGAATYQPQQINSGSILNSNLGAYMNPFVSNVVDSTMRDMGRQTQMLQGQNAANAQRAGAFGGSRHGVVEAETNRGAMDAFGRTASQLYSDAFGSATGLATGDLNRDLAAQSANQNAGLSAAQLQLAGGAQMGQLGQLQQQMGFNGAAALGNIGSMQQELAQQRLDAQRNLGIEQQNIRNSGVGMLSPLAGNQTTTQRQSQGWGQMLGNAIQAGSLFASDERLKEDVAVVRDPLGKLSFLSGNTYRYKAGHGLPTKRTGGVMAQDVERVLPGAVGDLPGGNGMKGVDYTQVTGLLVEAVKELDKRTRVAA
ncbi:tail fiber domain-containing protein [Flavobacterium sp.]|uniref:tail fiber domain-containing protein n=1 Tax=Flavobacterium sp. TaxID=239 RepID=UPI0037C130A4